jgi:hypothetical protein
VTPLPNSVPDLGPGFEHHRPQPALQGVRGGGEAHGSRSNDGDGLLLAFHFIRPSRNIE